MELKHYGVKGMQWGVRRTDAQLAKTRKRTIVDSDDYKQAHSKKKQREKSNDELRKENERYRLEQENNKLRSEKGMKAVKGVLAAGLTVGAVAGTAYIYKKHGKQAFEKIKGLAFSAIELASKSRGLFRV